MAGGPRSREVIKTRLKLPQGIAKRVHEMAAEREMKLDDLLSELVEVAVIELNREVVSSVEDRLANPSPATSHVLHDPTRA